MRRPRRTPPPPPDESTRSTPPPQRHGAPVPGPLGSAATGRRLATAAVAALMVGSLAVPTAWAAPGDPAGDDGAGPTRSDVRDARAAEGAALDDVAGVQAALDAANAELERASEAAARAAEAYNGARWRAQVARKESRAADRAAARAARALAAQRDTYRRTIVSTVGSDLDLSAMTAMFEADGVESLLSDASALERVQGSLEAQHTAYTDASTAATEAKETAETAAATATDAAADARTTRDAAAAAASTASTTAADIAERKAALQRRLARLQGVTVALVTERAERAEAARQARAEEAARRARERAARQARAAEQPSDPGGSSGPADGGSAPSDSAPADTAPTGTAPPPASGGAAAAVAFARAQIGEPYVWAAAGPSSWDCSGLTMAAWQAGGKSLPHYSVAQYDATTPISPGDLRPGDLVFWGDGGDPSSIYHVALYVGDGRIVHAPRTGRPVTEESLYYWRAPDFYGRP